MALQRECNEKQDHIRKLYACEHNPVYPGNIITDHYHTIKVEKISMYGHPVPYMKYIGTNQRSASPCRTIQYFSPIL